MRETTHTVPTQKVTMNLPVDLVKNAPKYLGKSSLTEVVQDAVRDAMHRQACLNLLKARGTFDPKVDWKALRKDD
jgi:hypothetical protein